MIKNKKKMRHPGFTLVEIMVVTALISIVVISVANVMQMFARAYTLSNALMASTSRWTSVTNIMSQPDYCASALYSPNIVINPAASPSVTPLLQGLKFSTTYKAPQALAPQPPYPSPSPTITLLPPPSPTPGPSNLLSMSLYLSDLVLQPQTVSSKNGQAPQPLPSPGFYATNFLELSATFKGLAGYPTINKTYDFMVTQDSVGHIINCSPAPASAIPEGILCGYRDVHNLQVSCGGTDPAIGCPPGYLQGAHCDAYTGDNNSSSNPRCISQAVAYCYFKTGVELAQGTLCGLGNVTVDNPAGYIQQWFIPCGMPLPNLGPAGLNPSVKCPPGYQQVQATDAQQFNNSSGDAIWTCASENRLPLNTPMPGTLCGFSHQYWAPDEKGYMDPLMIQFPNPTQCKGFDVRSGCPPGYEQAQVNDRNAPYSNYGAKYWTCVLLPTAQSF